MEWDTVVATWDTTVGITIVLVMAGITVGVTIGTTVGEIHTTAEAISTDTIPFQEGICATADTILTAIVRLAGITTAGQAVGTTAGTTAGITAGEAVGTPVGVEELTSTHLRQSLSSLVHR